ncbi:MAG: fumarylacetoacetate hydrolase family protein [Planctomycetota bacterium]
MRIARFGPVGNERPAIIENDGIRRDCSAWISDWTASVLRSGKLAELARRDLSTLPQVNDSERWAACVPRPGKVICIGLNYSDHAKESGMPIPAEPIIFMKAANTVVGPYDDVRIPRLSTKTDWEVELGVVIGRDASYLASPAEAAAHIAGYCISHDVSEREFQLERGGQWTKGKSCDTFNPLGPWLMTPDQVGDPQQLAMSLDVNGQRMQTGSTATMIFPITVLVHYLSQFMTLEAGDLISTGTPPGVGLGHKPPRFLSPGDVVELTITGLGTQRQRFVATPQIPGKNP